MRSYEDAFSESSFVRRLRRRRRFALSGDARGVVVLVPDVALLPGRDDSRQPRRRRAARASRPGGDRRHGQAEYDLVILHTSTPSFRLDCRTAAMIKDVNPQCVIGFVGGHVTAEPAQALAAGDGDRFRLPQGDAITPSRRCGRAATGPTSRASPIGATVRFTHNPDRPVLGGDDLDALPFVTQIYHRDLDYLKYNSPYCQYPYVSLYTGRGCPARCTFCLWPQVTTGHSYRVRSPENVLRGSARDAAPVPGDEGDLLRRRHVHGRSAAGAQDRRAAAPARVVLVDQLARQRRSRDACRS